MHAKNQWQLNIEHYWKSLLTKPGALQHCQAIKQASNKIKDLFNEYYLQNAKVFIQLCLLCKTQQIDIQTLQEATQLTIKQSPHCPLSFDKVKWNMKNLTDQTNQTRQPHGSTDQQNSMSALIEQQCEKQLRDIQSII